MQATEIKAIRANGYPELNAIPKKEWSSYFDHSGEKWNSDEDDYIRSWFPIVETMEIAFALGRTPWNITSRAKKLHVDKLNCGRANCKQCGKEFDKQKVHQVYCSKKCVSVK